MPGMVPNGGLTRLRTVGLCVSSVGGLKERVLDGFVVAGEDLLAEQFDRLLLVRAHGALPAGIATAQKETPLARG